MNETHTQKMNVISLMQYPGVRPTIDSFYTSRTKIYKYLKKTYVTVQQVWPDDGYDDGWRLGKIVTTYSLFAERLTNNKPLHLRCTNANGTQQHLTVRVFPMK